MAEQIFTLLDRSNYQFASPDFLGLSLHKTVFTPIEEKLLKALEKHQLSYQPQVCIGRHIVDFVVDIQKAKIIVECDGRAYHDPARDHERDKVLAMEGYSIRHFSGAEIYADVEKCVAAIKEISNYQTTAAYTLDDDLDASQQAAVQCSRGPI